MSPPLKPEVAVIDGKVWQFMAGSYHSMTSMQAYTLICKLQKAHNQLVRETGSSL